MNYQNYVEMVRRELEELEKLDVISARLALRRFDTSQVIEYAKQGTCPTDCASLLMDLA